jgi:hypothetical protein
MVLRADPLFVESNQMHAINGYVYANLPGLVMTETEFERWQPGGHPHAAP